MFKEIVDYIASVSGLRIGIDLFAGYRPPNAKDICSVIIETGGGTDEDLKDRKDLSIQIISRGRTYFEARKQAYEIYDELHGRVGIKLTSIMINSIIANSIPGSIGQDEKGYFEFSTNYIFRISAI